MAKSSFNLSPIAIEKMNVNVADFEIAMTVAQLIESMRFNITANSNVLNFVEDCLAELGIVENGQKHYANGIRVKTFSTSNTGGNVKFVTLSDVANNFDAACARLKDTLEKGPMAPIADQTVAMVQASGNPEIVHAMLIQNKGLDNKTDGGTKLYLCYTSTDWAVRIAPSTNEDDVHALATDYFYGKE